MIVYLGVEVIIIIFLGKSVGGLDIHSNLLNALAMSVGLLIASLLTVIAVGKIWLELRYGHGCLILRSAQPARIVY